MMSDNNDLGAIAASGTGALAVPVEPVPVSPLTGFDHTIAGPWRFSHVLYRWDMTDRRNVYDANGEFVCMVNAPHREPCARDYVIRAAPELLAALKGAIGALEFSRDYHRDLSNEEQAFAQDKLDAAVKAIANAGGQ